MKKALISPREKVETGYRVADVSIKSFEVASPLFWTDCPDDLKADEKWYDPADGQFKDFPQPEPAENQPVTTGTQEL